MKMKHREPGRFMQKITDRLKSGDVSVGDGERIEMAKAEGSFWQDYKFTDPLTKKNMAKSMYCEKADDKAIICGGVYKE